MESMNPLVSCLMVTQKGRKDFLASAVRQFENQDYIPRELVIVTNAPEELPAFHNSAINVFPYPRGTPRLGGLRNASVEHAQGSVLAIWDDDDVRQPAYLASQVSCLGSLPIVMLPKVMLQCVCGAVVTSARRTWECSMVIQKDIMCRYAPMDRQEDTRLLDDLHRKGHRWTFNNQDGLYLKRFHGNNAWGAAHNAKQFAAATPPHSCVALLGN